MGNLKRMPNMIGQRIDGRSVKLSTVAAVDDGEQKGVAIRFEPHQGPPSPFYSFTLDDAEEFVKVLRSAIEEAKAGPAVN